MLPSWLWRPICSAKAAWFIIGLGEYPSMQFTLCWLNCPIGARSLTPSSSFKVANHFLSNWLCQILSTAGIPGNFPCHSFCCGAATGNYTRNWVAMLTWDQALFLFRFENYIPAGMVKRKESLIQTFYKTSAAHFFDWLTFAKSANQNYFHCLFF